MRFVLCFALSLLAGAMPAAAWASPPDPFLSSSDPILVGDSSGRTIVDFHVTLRDAGGYPMPGHDVEILFGGTGVRPYSEQVAGVRVDCPTLQVGETTDLNGVATFHLRLGGFENGALVQVRGQGLLIGKVPARSTDLNGDGRTDTEDLRLFRDRFLWRPDAPETDYDLSGKTTLDDLRILRDEIVATATGTPCA